MTLDLDIILLYQDLEAKPIQSGINCPNNLVDIEAAKATEDSGQPSSHETNILDLMHAHSPQDLQPLPSLHLDGFGHGLEAPEQTSAFDRYIYEEGLQWWVGGHGWVGGHE